MISALKAAECFLSLANNEVECDITPLKLQKLLYYAEGLSLAFGEESLFRESIYAWKYGPVVKEVYEKYSFAGRSSIPCVVEVDEAEISQDDFDTIKTAMKFYGKYSAQELVRMTHREEPYISSKLYGEIDRTAIASYFRNKIYSEIPPEIEDAGLRELVMENASTWL